MATANAMRMPQLAGKGGRTSSACPGPAAGLAFCRRACSTIVLPHAWCSCRVPVQSTSRRSANHVHAADGSRPSLTVALNDALPVTENGEYTVVLDQPAGLTLVQDPSTGQVIIQAIKEGSPAEACQRIQVGDVVVSCSALFRQDLKRGSGDMAWHTVDLRRMRWALGAGASKVQLVLQRPQQCGPSWAPWCSDDEEQLQEHTAPQDPMQQATESEQQQRWHPQQLFPFQPLQPPPNPLAGISRGSSWGRGPATHNEVREQLQGQPRPAAAQTPLNATERTISTGLSFSGSSVATASQQGHASGSEVPQPCLTPSQDARQQRLFQRRRELAAARTQAALDLEVEVAKLMDRPGYGVPSAGLARDASGSSKPGSTAGSAAKTEATVPASRKKKVIPFLPWLLVATTRMDTRELTSLASARGLGALLELSLTPSSARGYLAVRGMQHGITQTDVNVSSLMPPAAPDGDGETAGQGDSPKTGAAAAGRGTSVSSEAASSHKNGNKNGTASSVNSSASAAAGGGPVVSQATGTVAPVSTAGGTGSAVGSGLAAEGSTRSTTTGSIQAPMNGTPAAAGQLLPSASPDGGVAVEEDADEARLLLHAAACLQRLVFRHQAGSRVHYSCKNRCAVLLHCEDGVDSQVGNLLAGWLHWYSHMPLQEAILAVEQGLGAMVHQALLEEATEHLLREGEQRRSRVVLSWRHGALAVSVAGDIVGGWHNSVSMVRCTNPFGCKGLTSRGHFYLPLVGLKPGVYYYKFIVDGTWAVDPFAPKAMDNYGNFNNALEVHPRLAPVTSADKLRLARWQAGQLALDSKMMRHL